MRDMAGEGIFVLLRESAGECGRQRPAEKTGGKPAVRSSCEGTGGVVS